MKKWVLHCQQWIQLPTVPSCYSQEQTSWWKQSHCTFPLFNKNQWFERVKKTLFCTAIGKILPKQSNHHLCSSVCLWHTPLQHARSLVPNLNTLFCRLLCNTELCKGHCFCKCRNIHWYFNKSCTFCRLNESLFSGLWCCMVSSYLRTLKKSSKTSQLLLYEQEYTSWCFTFPEPIGISTYSKQDRPCPKAKTKRQTYVFTSPATSWLCFALSSDVSLLFLL